jgi:GDP-L-fucose synthase
MNKDSKIYIAGHTGMVGSSLLHRFSKEGYTNLLLRTRRELNLLNQQAVTDFFTEEKPEYVFLVAAKVGGIVANNTYQAEFIYDNLQIQNNVIHHSFVSGVKKLLFLGSSCIYPRNCSQPMKEEYLMTGHLEPTNSSYAVAKIAGIEMCWAYNRQYETSFLPVMPTNLYGPNDNFDLNTSHVLPALIRKFHEAKQEDADFVTIWGTGKPRREFLHADDLVDACIYLMNIADNRLSLKDSPLFNIGTGIDLTINQLARLIGGTIGFKGKIINDFSKPDGTPQKLLDTTKLKNLGWQPEISLSHGIQQIYKWYKDVKVKNPDPILR